MNTKSITVVVQLLAKAGKENQLREELLSLVDPSRRDAGCLNYDLHQAVDNPGLFLFHENWASKEHLDQHLQTPHVQRVISKLGELTTVAPQITLWEKIR